MAAGRRAMLDDEDDDEEETEEAQLGYNEKYAQRFAHNKKREDLHRLQELQKKGLAGGVSDDDESSSSEEEDDDGLLPAQTEEKILETLTMIKTRDPSIYSSDTKFFEDDAEEEDRNIDDGEAAGGAKLKKQKPLYLKDVNARQLLEGGMEEDEDEGMRKPKTSRPSYFNEQDELKRAFLQGVIEAEGGEEGADDLLKVKKRTKEELERDAREAEEAVAEAEQRAKDNGIAKRLEDYFGRDDALDDDDKFLKEYLLNKGWIDQDQKPKYPTNNDFAEDISEDEEALDKQDQFEKDYNFRYQEGDNTYVKGHSRIIDDSVRKKSETRKKQREKKKERESDEARARREELKRLKNVTKREVLEKLSKIRAVAGVNAANGGGVEVLGEDDLDEDFDPDEYDKKMTEAFGEEYYGAEDPDFADDDDNLDEVEKPDFDAEDELLGIAPEAADSSAGFAAITAKLGQSSAKPEKKKLKVPLEEKLVIDKHLEEYYKLDYEDVIGGDLPTRFKYRPVKPNKYGLKTKDIISRDDKELNQYISVKKLAPYTTEEWEPRYRAPWLSSRGRTKKALSSGNTPKKKKNVAEAEIVVNTLEAAVSTPNAETANDDHHQTENGENVSQGEKEGDGGAGSPKKKKNRKRKKPGAPSPLPMSRLLSYAPASAKKTIEGTRKKKGKKDNS